MTDNKKPSQPEKDIDEIINDLRSVITPNDHLGTNMISGFMEVPPDAATNTVQPEITPGEPSLAAQTGGAATGLGAIRVPVPPGEAAETQPGDNLTTGAPLAEGLQGVAQAVDEQDKDLRENYGAGTASEQGPPPEASEKSRRTMGGNTLR